MAACIHLFLCTSVGWLIGVSVGDGESVGLQYPVGDGDGKKLSPAWGMGMGTGNLLQTGTGKNKQSPHGGRPVDIPIHGHKGTSYYLVSQK
jgi:hypothetical protein